MTSFVYRYTWDDSEQYEDQNSTIPPGNDDVLYCTHTPVDVYGFQHQESEAGTYSVVKFKILRYLLTEVEFVRKSRHFA